MTITGNLCSITEFSQFMRMMVIIICADTVSYTVYAFSTIYLIIAVQTNVSTLSRRSGTEHLVIKV